MKVKKGINFNSAWGTIKIVIRGKKKDNLTSNYGINEDGIPINILTKKSKQKETKNEKINVFYLD